MAAGTICSSWENWPCNFSENRQIMHEEDKMCFSTRNRTDRLNYYLLYRDAIILIKVFNTNSRYIAVVQSEVRTDAKLRWVKMTVALLMWVCVTERKIKYVPPLWVSPRKTTHVVSCVKYFSFWPRLNFSHFVTQWFPPSRKQPNPPPTSNTCLWRRHIYNDTNECISFFCLIIFGV